MSEEEKSKSKPADSEPKPLPGEESKLDQNHALEDDEGELRPRGWRVSWAWFFPLVAALATGWIFYSSWKAEGPEIEIRFTEAPGIQAGKTPLFYRGVSVGKVTDVQLANEHSHAVVKVRLKAFAADLARVDSDFWIDRPEISIEQISGLDSLIQGNSIQVRKGSGPPARDFAGLDKPPLTPLTDSSLVVRLNAHEIPFVSRGTPVYHRGVAVGKVEHKDFDRNGNPYLWVMINQEFERTVMSTARFWSINGVAVRAGPGQLRINVAGLSSFLKGGIEFENFGDDAEPAEDGMEFDLFQSEQAAFSAESGIRVLFENGQGLLAGETQLRYLGVPIGLVREVKPNPSTGKVEAILGFEAGYERLRNTGSTFTLVRPRISLEEGVSGLETLVSGVYVECTPGEEGAPIGTEFIGRSVSEQEWNRSIEEAEGVHLTLQAADMPGINKDAPIYFRGIQVGRVLGKGLNPMQRPYLQIVIRKEFGGVVRRNSRFWRIAATSVEAGPGLLRVNIMSLQSLLLSGVEFDVFGEADVAAADGTLFELFSNEREARASSSPIRIQFDNGQGLLAGQTQLRYLGVPVGLVDSVQTRNGRVEVSARLDPDHDMLRREGTSFTVVRPVISLEGVSGLETLVSGVYIDCVPGGRGKLAETFTGKSRVATPADAEGGFLVNVTAKTSGIGVNSPVFYRGLKIGKVARKTLASNGQRVDFVLSINPAYSQLVRTDSKFWDVSGLQASLGFFYLRIKPETLQTLATGGIAFATPNEPGPLAKRSQVFELHPSPRKEWLRWEPVIPLR